jgi:integrase
LHRARDGHTQATWRKYLKLAQGYTAHELRRVCASLLIAPGASDVQMAHRMGHSKTETTKNIDGHLFAQDRSIILTAINQAVTRLYAYENNEPNADGDADAVA